MKKILIAFLIIILVVMTACESREVRERREQKEQAKVNFAQQAVEKCSAEEDDYDETVCIVEEAVELEDKGYRVVDELCSKTEMEDMCKFFSAYVLENTRHCVNTEASVACRMVSSKTYCNSMGNKNSCLANKAFLVRFVDRQEAMKICSYLKSRGYEAVGDDITCDDIDFEVDELDSDPFYDRLFYMYVFAKIADYEVHTVYV
jgi:hypothetical protein